MSLHPVTKYPVVDLDPSSARVISNFTTGEILFIPTLGFTYGALGFFTGNSPHRLSGFSVVEISYVNVLVKNDGMTYQSIVFSVAIAFASVRSPFWFILERYLFFISCLNEFYFFAENIDMKPASWTDAVQGFFFVMNFSQTYSSTSD